MNYNEQIELIESISLDNTIAREALSDKNISVLKVILERQKKDIEKLYMYMKIKY